MDIRGKVFTVAVAVAVFCFNVPANPYAKALGYSAVAVAVIMVFAS